MKLSNKMIEVMEQLRNSKHYYLDFTETSHSVQNLHMKDASILYHRGGYILKDGTIGIVGNTSTLKALAKRGLIEIVEIGGTDMDIIKFDHEFDQPLTTVSKINVHTKWYDDYCGKVLEQNFTEYMELGTLEAVQERMNVKYAKRGGATVTIIGEVELDIWQP